MIKAIFFDIDGTLVSFETHSIPQSTIETLARLRQSGIKLFIATGRQFGLINNLQGIEFDGYVTINGAITLVGGQIIDKHPIAKDQIEAACEYIDKKKSFPCTFVMADRIAINYINEDVEALRKQINFPHIPLDDLRTLNDEDVYQMISFFKEDIEADVMSHLKDCSSARWSPIFTDIIASGVSKVCGIEAVCRHFDIRQDEVMAIGDGGNDIEMIQWAGVGVAMGNATDNVKKAADFVTTSVDDDGIFNAANRYIFN